MATAPALARVTFDSHLTDALIVQRGAPWHVSGNSDAETKVTVKWGDRRYEAVPAGRRWGVDIAIAPDMAGPAVISIEGSEDSRRVLLGDLWLCGGQSNMAMTTARAADGEELARDVDKLPLRLMKISPPGGRGEASAPRWQEATKNAGRAFSAVCLAFGAELQRKTGIPFGLIDASLGGTRIEAWIGSAGWPAPSPRGVANDLHLNAPMEAPATFDKNRESAAFEAMISPLVSVPIRGVLWYQGESNRVNASDYARLLAAMMGDWRHRWGNPSLAFVIMQLPGFGPEAVTFDPYSPVAAIRHAQRLAVARDAHAVAVTTLDLGDEGLHPPRKQGFGLRAAWAAFERFYARSAPRLLAVVDPPAVTEGDQISVDLRLLTPCVRLAGPLSPSVRIAGADEVWYVAQARLIGDRLVARTPDVARPVALRYAWADRPPVPLRECEQDSALPAFRTDAWPLTRPAGRAAR